MSKFIVKTIIEQSIIVFKNVRIVISCVSKENCWDYQLDGNPLYKHIYHTIHSLDQWFINPNEYSHPLIHKKDMNNLYILDKQNDITLKEMISYLDCVEEKIMTYLETLYDIMLEETPDNCQWNRLTLILGQFRHLHTHLGMIMAVLVIVDNVWPEVIGLEETVGDISKY